MIVASLIVFGCSGAPDTPTQPGLTAPTERTPSQEGRVIWGVYQLAFNPADGTVTVAPNRELEKHYNVTQFVRPPACYDCVKIVGSLYNPAAQEWTLGVLLKNPNIMPGYDVRGLVTNTLDKWLKNADGFMNNYGQDMSFRAFNRIDPARVFWPLTTSQESYIFHFPPGSNWAFVDYIIDASWPGKCKEPLIEDVSFQTLIDQGVITQPLTVRAFDHQGDFFVVLADLTPLGGTQVALFDDGQHGDGNSDDGIFGTEDAFVNAPPGDYAFNIWAFDEGMNYGWNSWHVTLTGIANKSPIIDEITITRTTFTKGSTTEKTNATCTAHDPDGDTLHYHWTCAGGVFTNPDLKTVEWKPPSVVSKYNLTCEVTDGKGGSVEGQSPTLRVTKYTIIAVAPNFTVPRVIGTGSFSLTDYCPGKVILLNFWATT
jgi:hypothetical protein